MIRLEKRIKIPVPWGGDLYLQGFFCGNACGIMPGAGSCSPDFRCFSMKPFRRGCSNPDLFRERLDAIIVMHQGLVRLAALMPC